MKTSLRYAVLTSALALALPFVCAHAGALSYHGTLQDAGKPADGKYDMQLTLYSAQTGGRALAAPVTLYGVPVHAGNFSTSVDFGASATSDGTSWVAASIRPAGTGDFVALDTRTAANTDAPSTCDGTWALDGNSGNPSGSFLGTTDTQPLRILVDGQQAGYIAASGTANQPNIVFGGSTNSVHSSVVNAVISGGASNEVTQPGGIVAGGYGNTAGGENSFVAGYANVAGGAAATIPGGHNNITLGNYSFAAGLGATALTDGDFVWADSSANNAFGSSNPYAQPNTFNVRAIGGFYFVSGVNGSGQYVGVKVDPGSGSWSSLSDRNMKTAIAVINPSHVLDGVLAMPLSTWQYVTQKAGIRHLGPMAQDFFAAFHLGEDDRHITDIDEGGVALAAIQGLNQKLDNEVRKIADENAALKAQNATLVAKLDRLDARMAAFEVAQHQAHATKFRVAQLGE